jgi:heme/copper-type cytochrome/quinol oxidase subunit 4
MSQDRLSEVTERGCAIVAVTLALLVFWIIVVGIIWALWPR